MSQDGRAPPRTAVAYGLVSRGGIAEDPDRFITVPFVRALKERPGKAIGVHASSAVVRRL